MTDPDCLFCKIAAGEIQSSIVYSDDEMAVFRDIEPKANVHLLAVPREHFAHLSDMTESDADIVKRMLEKIPAIAKDNGCEGGYRLTINQGPDAGQTVFHLHMHILGGEKLPEF